MRDTSGRENKSSKIISMMANIIYIDAAHQLYADLPKTPS